MTKSSGSDSNNTLYCSFCGKSQHEVGKLIAGPTVFICDECVELCIDIIRKEHKTRLVNSRDGPSENQTSPSEADWEQIQISLWSVNAAVADARRALEAMDELLAHPQDLTAEYLLRCGWLYLPDSQRMARAVAGSGLSAAKDRKKVDDYRALMNVSRAVGEHCAVVHSVTGLIDPQELAAANLLACGRVHLPDSARMTEAVEHAGLSAAKGRSELDDYREVLEVARRVSGGEKERPACLEVAKLVLISAGVSLENNAERLKNTADRFRRKFRADKVFYLQQVAKASATDVSLESIAERLRVSLARPVIVLGSSGVEVSRRDARRRRLG